MDKTTMNINGWDMDIYSLNTVVVGSGAAGLNAADCLYNLGQRDIAIVTEGLKMGTSRNTGSDKQTYYKLTISGSGTDSVMEMAKTLFAGGCMHGDIALAEAANSVRAFSKLVEIGVPFPQNRYGEFIGYKTDHDPRHRATSAGPLTSKFITEKLEEQVLLKNIKIFDGYQIIGILTDTERIEDEIQKRAVGLIAIDLTAIEQLNRGFTLFNCTNIVYATGGPAAMYLTSVYPESQTGASGIAFEAGVRGINLTESQYGIASVKFRWNLSGTYQQVIPRYVSTNKDGTGEREFLNEFFENPGEMLDAIFLKGYQWPFDPRKVENLGSSLIDVLVYQETHIKGRTVYLDFMRNPSWGSINGEIDFTLLGQEANTYIKNSGALFGTPIQRLKKMNMPAIDLYKNNGIDLENEYLEIAVCAQHNNGGLVGNLWGESNIRHFFSVGEVNGTFGVYRPGGSALNSTQVGSLRAAQYIAENYSQPPQSAGEFLGKVCQQVIEKLEFVSDLTNNPMHESNVMEARKRIQSRMTGLGAHIRSREGIDIGISECIDELKDLTKMVKMGSFYELPYVFQNRDMLLTQYVYLSAIKEYIESGGKSRGSYLIHDAEGCLPVEGLPEKFRFTLEDGSLSGKVCEIELHRESMNCETAWKPVRPIPVEENWFENVWNDYRNRESFR